MKDWINKLLNQDVTVDSFLDRPERTAFVSAKDHAPVKVRLYTDSSQRYIEMGRHNVMFYEMEDTPHENTWRRNVPVSLDQLAHKYILAADHVVTSMRDKGLGDDLTIKNSPQYSDVAGEWIQITPSDQKNLTMFVRHNGRTLGSITNGKGGFHQYRCDKQLYKAGVFLATSVEELQRRSDYGVHATDIAHASHKSVMQYAGK